MSSVSSLAKATRQSQSWFPGKYVPVRHILGVEVFEQPRGGVQVAKTTIHGTAPELRLLAAQMLRAAAQVEKAHARAA